MSKKTMVGGEWRRWEGLNPEILALIFLRIPMEEMVSSVPFVCKGWMEAVAGPYCWSEIDLEAWCRRRNDSHEVDMVVKKLVRRSKFRVQLMSTYRMGETGFFFVAHCGNFLKELKMPMTDITDQMVLKHIKPLPNLTVLDISHCVKITSKGIAAFGHQCKSLLHLKRNLPAFNVELNDESEAKAITETMPDLQRIELCYGRFSDLGVYDILTKCKALTHLHIQGSWNADLGGDIIERSKRLQRFQSPWYDSDDRFSDTSEGSGDDVTDSDQG